MENENTLFFFSFYLDTCDLIHVDCSGMAADSDTEGVLKSAVKSSVADRDKWGRLESAGINRHRVGDERALHERIS